MCLNLPLLLCVVLCWINYSFVVIQTLHCDWLEATGLTRADGFKRLHNKIIMRQYFKRVAFNDANNIKSIHLLNPPDTIPKIRKHPGGWNLDPPILYFFHRMYFMIPPPPSAKNASNLAMEGDDISHSSSITIL